MSAIAGFAQKDSGETLPSASEPALSLSKGRRPTSNPVEWSAHRPPGGQHRPIEEVKSQKVKVKSQRGVNRAEQRTEQRLEQLRVEPREQRAVQPRIEVEIEVKVQVEMERRTQLLTQANTQLTTLLPELRAELRRILRGDLRSSVREPQGRFQLVGLRACSLQFPDKRTATHHVRARSAGLAADDPVPQRDVQHPSGSSPRGGRLRRASAGLELPGLRLAAVIGRW